MGLRTQVVESTTALPGAKQVDSAPVEKAASRDYKVEARREIEGKVRMNCIVAALQSPAGPAFAPTAEAYKALVKELADLAYEYTFQGEGK